MLNYFSKDIPPWGLHARGACGCKKLKNKIWVIKINKVHVNKMNKLDFLMP